MHRHAETGEMYGTVKVEISSKDGVFGRIRYSVVFTSLVGGWVATPARASPNGSPNENTMSFPFVIQIINAVCDY